MTIYTALYLTLSLIALAALVAGSARELCAMEDKWEAYTPIPPPPLRRRTN